VPHKGEWCIDSNGEGEGRGKREEDGRRKREEEGRGKKEEEEEEEEERKTKKEEEEEDEEKREMETSELQFELRSKGRVQCVLWQDGGTCGCRDGGIKWEIRTSGWFQMLESSEPREGTGLKMMESH
jgi:hypothetical protein